MPLLIRQSMTPYCIPFYAIASLYCNAFFVPPIYDPLRYSFLCYCTNKLQCPCYQANLWHPTLLLFMLLYHCIEMLFLSHQSMSLYGTPFYAIVAINCNAFFCPTNQWPSTVLLFMLLHHCIAMHYFTQPIYDPLLYSFLCYCTYPNLWHSTVLGHAEKGESAPNDETPDQSMTLYGTWPKIKVRLTTNPQIESDLKQVLRYSQNYNKSLTIVRLITSPQ